MSTAEETRLELLVKQLKDDNETYRKNFEHLRHEYMEIYNTYNEQTLRWKSQLDTKTQEFDKLRHQFDQESRELEQMRIKLQEEMNTRAMLQKEVEDNEKNQSLYQKARREYEALKIELTSLKEERDRQVKDLRSESDHLTNELKSTQSKVETLTINVNQLTERNIELSSQVEQSGNRIAMLLQEIEDLQTKKADLLRAKEEVAMTSSKQFAELLVKTKSLEAEVERYQKKMQLYEEERENYLRSHERMHEQVLKLEKDNVQYQTALNEHLNSVSSEKQAIKYQYETRIQELEHEKMSINQQCSELRRKVDELQEVRLQLQARVSEADARAGNKVKALQIEHEDKESISQKEICSLRTRVLDLEKQVFTIQQEYSNERHNLQTKLEQQHIEIIEATSEKERMEAVVANYKEQISQVTNIIESNKKVAKEAYEKLNRASRAELERQNQQLHKAKSILHDNLLEHKKLQKVYTKYKQMAKTRIQTLLSQVQDLQHQVQQLRQEYEDLKFMHTQEQQKQSKAIRDLERERDKLKFILDQRQMMSLEQPVNLLAQTL